MLDDRDEFRSGLESALGGAIYTNHHLMKIWLKGKEKLGGLEQALVWLRKTYADNKEEIDLLGARFDLTGDFVEKNIAWVLEKGRSPS